MTGLTHPSHGGLENRAEREGGGSTYQSRRQQEACQAPGPPCPHKWQSLGI